jgi:L-fuconolactonase
MRIDAHQHFWRYSPQSHAWIDESMAVLRRDFMPEHLRPELDRSSSAGSIAVQAAQTLDENRFLLELGDRHDWVLGVVGWVDLCADDVARTLEPFAVHPKFVGVRHIVQSEPDDFMSRPDFRRGVAALAEFDLAYDILIYARQLPAALDLVHHLPDQRFVLDHIAKPEIRSGPYGLEPWSSHLRELAQSPNVCCKVSGLVTEADWGAWSAADLVPYLDVVFEAFAPERLMIGSDWPVCTLAATHARVIETVREYARQLDETQQGALFGDTAAEFYRVRTSAVVGGAK